MPAPGNVIQGGTSGGPAAFAGLAPFAASPAAPRRAAPCLRNLRLDRSMVDLRSRRLRLMRRLDESRLYDSCRPPKHLLEAVPASSPGHALGPFRSGTR